MFFFSFSVLADNALHMTMLPPLMERFIQRLIQFEPMLGISTLGIMLGVPVVSMRSILELMGGRPVSDEDDADAMRNFIMRCMQGQDGLIMLPYVGVDEYSANSNRGKFPGLCLCIPPHVFCFSSPH